MGGSGVDQVCPVCRTPEQDGEFCAVCQWRLYDDPVLGELTEQDVQRARSALQAAGHAWDARAVALSAAGSEDRGGPGDGRLAAVIRGGPPRPGEKVPTGPPELSGNWSDSGSAEYEKILEDLLGHRIGELLFIEFTPDRVSVIKVTVGGGGIPRQVDAGSTNWRSMAPVLDSGPEIRRFQLAGGIGTLPPVSRTEFDTTVLHWLKAYIPPSYERSIVLLKPRDGWVLLERAAATVRTAYALRAELARGREIPAEGTTPEAVREVLRTAPLLADHTLLLAQADPLTGAVRTHSHVLFPSGTRLGPGETASAQVTVYGGVGDPAPLLLPVLAGTPAADGTGTEPLSVHRVTVRPLEQVRLTFVLCGPGEVGLVAPGTGSMDEPAGADEAKAPKERAALDVPALITGLPRRIIRPPRLELFVTVELSGASEGETQERLTFVRELLTVLARHDGSGSVLRTGAVGHYDHVIHENAYTSRRTLLMPPVPAGPAPTALHAMAAWRPERREQDLASSLEDALKAVVPLATGARGGEPVRRVVLIVARRPPGLPQQHGIVPTCPLGADWQAELSRLRSAGVRVMTRADPAVGPPAQDQPGIAARGYADAAWALLSADGSFRPGDDSAADVAEALTPPWRLDGPPCSLALATPLL
jgi:hypothetical protein